jgi:hypothetical protein
MSEQVKVVCSVTYIFLCLALIISHERYISNVVFAHNHANTN